MLTEKIRVVQSSETEDVEDIFSSAISLFPDDLRNQHGVADAIIIYESTRFGDIMLNIAELPNVQDRKLFAHYVWNASIYTAELISENPKWSVKNETVLELGAGVGLAGIVSALAGAARIVISDYPTPALLENIARNVKENVRNPKIQCEITGHQWGVIDDSFSQENKNRFTRIFAADCLWMPWEHANLAKSIEHFLSEDESARCFVVAGFHTGRTKLALFFDQVLDHDLEIESIHETDVDGKTRAWARERESENVSERKRWQVEAVLKRREAQR